MNSLEQKTRLELAALLRMIHYCGWSDLIYSHASAKIPNTEEILMLPYDCLFEDATASSLIKISYSSEPSQELTVNYVGLAMHLAIHSFRKNSQFVIHSHSKEIVALSSQKNGILPISQYSTEVFGKVGYYDYDGTFFGEQELTLLSLALSKNNFLIMKNHGSLVLANNVQSALFRQYALQKTCEVQVIAQATGQELVSIKEELFLKNSERKNSEDYSKYSSSQTLWNSLLKKIVKTNPGYDL